ncbi:MAG: FmdE family protein [Methanoregula sp.]|jgi:formylmethanofuran dehydrogenase subunit E
MQNTHDKKTRSVTYEDCVQFHGHSCPGLASGYRAATAAMTALGVARPEDEDLVAICETDACGVDAIQVIAGTTAGKGNLIIYDYGKHAFTFYNRNDGRAVRVTFHRNETTETGEFAALRANVFSGKASKDEEKQFREMMIKATSDLLHAPAEKILTLQEITMDAPNKARIFASVTCENCGESVADAKTRKVDGRCVCIPCAEGTHLAKKR